jgi:CheY-like chemotaxis protein
MGESHTLCGEPHENRREFAQVPGTPVAGRTGARPVGVAAGRARRAGADAVPSGPSDGPGTARAGGPVPDGGRPGGGPAAPAPHRPAPAAAAGGAGAERPAVRILAVDDKRPNLLALEAVLAGLGHEIVTADSGRAALRALMDATGFAVILLDVQMPDMDGYETALHIRRRPRTRDIPIIFLTAMDDDPSHVFRGRTAGAVDYLIKPFEPSVLRAKVEAFVQAYLESHPE